ncbi:HAD family hydrolase [Microvirga pudoricolor]|uniref:HAD family hydrolase n=1 Tax=Microvirga pudoricolor TaxID=2778729 RepID=UPI001950D2B8|nr:HAD family hydrolase [Microvirga pudoricolor]MBM6596327.1 HAD family hydrolase [Microvirga pudoricolor]
MKIAAILFDKDGTLIDYDKSWSGVNLAAGALAAAGDEDLAARLLVVGGADPATGRAGADSLLAAASTGEIASQWSRSGSPIPQDQLRDALDRLFQASVDHAVPVTDLAALFGRLKQRGLALGIASSDSELAIRRTIDRFGLEPFIDFVAGYDSGFGLKPGGGMVEAFCVATGVVSDRIAVVGDNTHDMHMAVAGRAGLRVAVLTGTGTPETLLPHCSICLPSIADLEAAILDAAE